MMLTKEQLEQELANGETPKSIAKKYNTSVWMVYKATAKYKVLPKKQPVVYQTCKVCGKKYVTTKHPGYCSYNCYHHDELLQTADKEYLEKETTDLGKQIKELRQKGYSYKKIAEELHCSKATVAYHCAKHNKEQAEKRIAADPNRRLHKHLDNFKRHRKPSPISKCADWNKKFRTASSRFQKDDNRTVIMTTKHYTYKEALKHIGGTNTKCYLTGRPIDITKDDYNLDHIIPVCKGGTGDLQNMGITCPQANASKANMTLDEYLALCKEVLLNFGYQVTDPCTNNTYNEQ